MRTARDLDRHPTIGFFHFSTQDQLDRQAIVGCPVRVGLEWGQIEPEPGRFDWNGRQARLVDELLGAHFRPMPALRCRSAWATEPSDTARASASGPPKDLKRSTALQSGSSYSASYARFVTAVVQRWPSLEWLVIDNEPNDPRDQWSGTVDDYLRLVVTACTAAREHTGASICDGGLQGDALTWIVISQHVEREQRERALAYHAAALGEQLTWPDLRKRLKRKRSRPAVSRAVELTDSGLYQYVDAVNFHHYQLPAGLAGMVEMLRSRAGDRPLVCNEFGIKEQFAETAAEAARLMTLKCDEFSALGVAPALWFTRPGEEGNNRAAVVTADGQLVRETAMTLVQAVAESAAR